MEGFYDIHHAEDATPSTAKTSTTKDARRTRRARRRRRGDKQITAVLVCIPKARADEGRTDVVAKLINDGKVAQAVVPVRVIADLFEGVVGKLQWILLGMAVLTVIEAGIGIMVSIYNSMSDRRHEIAVMRALGASRVTVMVIILLESILLSLMGGAVGLAARPRRDLALLADDRRLDRRGRRPVAVPAGRIDPDPRPGRAGLGGRLSAGDGRLPHRRGQVADHHAVRKGREERGEGRGSLTQPPHREGYKVLITLRVMDFIVWRISSDFITRSVMSTILAAPIANTNMNAVEPNLTAPSRPRRRCAIGR